MTSAVVALVVVILSPVAILVTLCMWGLWTLWPRVRAWMVGLGALAGWMVLVVWTANPLEIIVRSYEAWRLLLVSASAGATSAVLAVPRMVVLWAPAGLAVGLTGGALVLWGLERRLRRQPWHPRTRQQREQERQRELDRAAKRAASRDVQEQGDALAVVIGQGDLPREYWTVRRGLLVPSSDVLRRPQAIIAGPGAGKTEGLLRKVRRDAEEGRQCFLLECKGTDPELAARIVAAYLSVRPDARVGLWPGMPYDAWRFAYHPNELVDRMMGVESMSREGDAEFYATQTKRLLQLACTVPGRPPRSSTDLLERLDKNVLKGLWRNDEMAVLAIDALDDRAVAGALTRYSTFFAGLKGQFDGSWALEDVDLAVITIPTMADREDGNAAFGLIMADALNYAGARKDRTRPASFIVDEFSAMWRGRNMALDLAERGRDPGLAVTLTAQSTEGIGDARVAMRMLQACTGGVILMRNADPDLIIQLAGTRPDVDYSYRLDEWGAPSPYGTARSKARPAIDANEVRRARPGEAWIIDAGGVQHAQVIRELPDLDAYRQTAAVAQQGAAQAHEWGMTSVYWHHMADVAQIAAQHARELPRSRRPSVQPRPERPILTPNPSNDGIRELSPPPMSVGSAEFDELPRVLMVLVRWAARYWPSRWIRGSRR